MLTQYQINARLEPWREQDPWARQVPSGHACQNGGACGCKGACGGAGKTAGAASAPCGSAIEVPRSAAEVRAEALAELRGNAGLAGLLGTYSQGARSTQSLILRQRASSDSRSSSTATAAERKGGNEPASSIRAMLSNQGLHRKVPDEVALVAAGLYPTGSRRPHLVGGGAYNKAVPAAWMDCPDLCPWPDCQDSWYCWHWLCSCNPPPAKKVEDPPIISAFSGKECTSQDRAEAKAAGLCDDEYCALSKLYSSFPSVDQYLKFKKDNPGTTLKLKCTEDDEKCTVKCLICDKQNATPKGLPCTPECGECKDGQPCNEWGQNDFRCGKPPPPPKCEKTGCWLFNSKFTWEKSNAKDEATCCAQIKPGEFSKWQFDCSLPKGSC